MTSRRRLEENVNDRGRRRHLETRRQEVQASQNPLDKTSTTAERSIAPEIGADHLAILFVCQQGWQTLSSIIRGLNATRIPIGKTPLREDDVLSLLKELENQDFLNKIELKGRPAWTSTPKGRDIET